MQALSSWDTSTTITIPDYIGTLTAEAMYASPIDESSHVVYAAGDIILYSCLADLSEATFGTKFKRGCWDVPYFFLKRLREDPRDL